MFVGCGNSEPETGESEDKDFFAVEPQQETKLLEPEPNNKNLQPPTEIEQQEKPEPQPELQVVWGMVFREETNKGPAMCINVTSNYIEPLQVDVVFVFYDSAGQKEIDRKTKERVELLFGKETKVELDLKGIEPKGKYACQVFVEPATKEE